MPTRRGDQQRAFHVLLPAHVLEVDIGPASALKDLLDVESERRRLLLTREDPRGLSQRLYGIDLDPLDNPGLGRIL